MISQYTVKNNSVFKFKTLQEEFLVDQNQKIKVGVQKI